MFLMPWRLPEEARWWKLSTNVAQQQSQRRSVTPLNSERRVCARTGPPLISMHSHLPLSCQSRSLKITAWKKKHSPFPPSLTQAQWWTLWLEEWTLRRRIWTASPASEASSLLKRFVAGCPGPCHFHSSAAALLFHLSSALCSRPADSSWTWGESQQEERRGRGVLM